jgi:8-oxo-dGTP pyrophosphatase MutT (NUDIX family)
VSSYASASICVKADDTQRVAMVQRSLAPHPHKHAAGLWEFPGGRMDDAHPGEAPLDTAKREWTEEFGAPLPDGSLVGSWQSSDGSHVTFVWVVDHETPPGPLAPDDPEVTARAWWDQRLLPGNPAVRLELQDSDWTLIAQAGHVDQQRSSGRPFELRKKVRVKQADDPMTFGFDIDGTITEAVEQYRQIAKGLQSLGHDVLVVTGRPDASDFLAQVGFEYDGLVIVDRNKQIGKEKAKVLADNHADFMFDNRLKSGPDIAEVCPVTMQFDPMTDDPDKRALPPHLRRLDGDPARQARRLLATLEDRKKKDASLQDVCDRLEQIVALLEAKQGPPPVKDGVVKPHTPTAETVGLGDMDALWSVFTDRHRLPPHLRRLAEQQQMPDVNRHGEQMCCRDGLTAEQHRHDSSDGRCCTDIPPSEDTQ